MIRLLHISDFHLSNDKANIDKSQKIVDGLLDAVKGIVKEHTIDLVIFSGDAINRGGKDFDSIEDAFLSFQTILIEPLMDVLHLPMDRFVWCIGNHDINRNLDSENAELGIAGRLKTLQDVDDFCSNSKNLRDIRRIEPFKQYEKSYYESLLKNNYKFGNFESCYKYRQYIAFIKVLSKNWNSTIPEMLEELGEYGLDIDDFFKLERNVTFNLSTLVSDLNKLQMIIIGRGCDISSFQSKLASAFLPKVVYQLEEYGLPRMISRKIQNSGLINFEDSNLSLKDAISVFHELGINEIEKKVGIEGFERYILDYFYDGISAYNN